jgi:hypothetical protein
MNSSVEYTEIIAELKKDPENNTCFDCKSIGTD